MMRDRECTNENRCNNCVECEVEVIRSQFPKLTMTQARKHLLEWAKTQAYQILSEEVSREECEYLATQIIWTINRVMHRWH